MKKLLLLLLLTSCIAHKEVVIGTITECDDVKAEAWAKDCISQYKLDSVQVNLIGSVKADCYKQARLIFCKQVVKNKH